MKRSAEFTHAHGGIEFLYFPESSGVLTIDDRTYRIEPPALVLYKPYQTYLLRMDTPCKYSSLIVKPPRDKRLAQRFPELERFTSDLDRPGAVHQLFRLNEQQNAELFRLFRMFDPPPEEWDEHRHSEFFYSCCARLLSFFQTRICRAPSLNEPAAYNRAAVHIEKVMKWIDANYDREVTLDHLAEEVQLSPSYVSRLFRKYTGSTMIDYIGQKRLKEGALLLRTSSLPVSQIALRCGFADAAYFCRSFKKKYGLTPLEFRSAEDRLARLPGRS